MSNFKVNHSKLEILNISLSGEALQQLSSSFLFKTGSTSIRYLGINRTGDASQLFSGTSPPYSSKHKWTCPHAQRLSWLGRVNVLKMDVLPRFLYLLQTIPIYIPTSYFRKLRQMFSSFIWKAAQPRIKYDTLALPKAEGGAQMLLCTTSQWCSHEL